MGGGQSKHPEPEKVNVLDATSAADAASKSTSSSSGYSSSTPPAEETSKCPMHNADGSYSYDWRQIFKAAAVHGPKGSKPLSQEEQDKAMNGDASATRQQGGGCPVQHSPPPSSSGGGCPVQHDNSSQYHQQHPEYNVYSQPIDKTNQMPKGAKTQLPNPYQTKELSTDRVSSSIPKGGGSDKSTWTYPSPQQFYNALSRKGKLDASSQAEEAASEDDMATVVALHNNMNEKTWAKVLEWERQCYEAPTSSTPPKLLKFMGKPHDLSPKARLKHYLLGHPLPYDRHDWTILREDGTTVRYVIDYYYDETRASDSQESSSMPALHDREGTPSLLVDVRPALDSPREFFARTFQMPYQMATSQTNYEYLPMKGTPEMASQVQESVKVWQSIQQSRKQQQVEEERQEMEELAELKEILDEAMQITDTQAKEIARNFALAVRDCQKAKQRMENCGSEEECSRASMDLTLCFGEKLCPVQHASFVKVLSKDGDDAKIEAALETVTECVMLKTAERRVARQRHPNLFES